MAMNSPEPSNSLSGDVIAGPRLFRPVERFLQVEAASGIVLLSMALAALIWANSSAAASYEHLWHLRFSIGFGNVSLSESMHFLINEGLMTIFFLVVGLEIRREIHEGALANLRLAALPLIAALGGVAVPALIYVSLNTAPDLRDGWAVPTATDIAFAVGVLALLGKRVPSSLRVLLLALAIIDDIAAIIIIACFYSSGVQPDGLLIAASGVLLVIVFQSLGVRSALPFVLPGSIVWFGLLQAHVHPTLAGVVLGLVTPVKSALRRDTLLAMAGSLLTFLRERPAQAEPNGILGPLQRLGSIHRELLPPAVRVQAALHPWVAFGIMPLFALANAGVPLEGLQFSDLFRNSVSLGVMLGLVVGKPLGITLASLIAIRLGIAALPGGSSKRGLLLVGCLGGIGFTMAIFIAQLAFNDPAMLAQAKLAVLLASAMSAGIGLIIGWWWLALPTRADETEAIRAGTGS
jgi:Na+:H+ antiporter, NhaA family